MGALSDILSGVLETFGVGDERVEAVGDERGSVVERSERPRLVTEKSTAPDGSPRVTIRPEKPSRTVQDSRGRAIGEAIVVVTPFDPRRELSDAGKWSRAAALTAAYSGKTAVVLHNSPKYTVEDIPSGNHMGRVILVGVPSNEARGRVLRSLIEGQPLPAPNGRVQPMPVIGNVSGITIAHALAARSVTEQVSNIEDLTGRSVKLTGIVIYDPAADVVGRKPPGRGVVEPIERLNVPDDLMTSVLEFDQIMGPATERLRNRVADTLVTHNSIERRLTRGLGTAVTAEQALAMASRKVSAVVEPPNLDMYHPTPLAQLRDDDRSRMTAFGQAVTRLNGLGQPIERSVDRSAETSSDSFWSAVEDGTVGADDATISRSVGRDTSVSNVDYGIQ